MNNTTIASSYGYNVDIQRHIQRVMLITMVMTSVLIMLANLSVFYAVLMKSALRKSMHYRLIMSLSISDFLVGFAIFCAVYTNAYFFSCISMLSLLLVAESATTLQILLICLERIAILISSPLRHISVFIGLIWVISVAFGIAPALLWARGPETYVACTPQYIYGRNFWKQVTYMSVYFIIVYTLVALAFVYLTLALLNVRRRRICLVGAATASSSTAQTITNTATMSIISSRLNVDKKKCVTLTTEHGIANHDASSIARIDLTNESLKGNRLSTHVPKFGENSDGSAVYSQVRPTGVRVRDRQHVKAMMNIAAIVVLLTVCSLPYFLTILLDAHVVGGLSINTEARAAFMFVWLLNSVANPVIYIIRIKEYREAMFSCKKR